MTDLLVRWEWRILRNGGILVMWRGGGGQIRRREGD